MECAVPSKGEAVVAYVIAEGTWRAERNRGDCQNAAQDGERARLASTAAPSDRDAS